MRACAGIIVAVLTLSACKEDLVEVPQPVELSSESMGYYCQMDLLTHDGPKGQIHLEGMPAPIFFSQVKDTIAYLHMPEQSHAVWATYVQDMADAQSWALPGTWIPVEKAIYVIGSDQMGGMDAPEFVPFSDETAASDFATKHGGTLRRYSEITTQDVLNSAAPETDTEYQSDIAERLRALSSADGTN